MVIVKVGQLAFDLSRLSYLSLVPGSASVRLIEGGESGASTTVPITDSAAAALDAYLTAHPCFGTGADRVEVLVVPPVS